MSIRKCNGAKSRDQGNKKLKKEKKRKKNLILNRITGVVTLGGPTYRPASEAGY